MTHITHLDIQIGTYFPKRPRRQIIVQKMFRVYLPCISKQYQRSAWSYLFFINLAQRYRTLSFLAVHYTDPFAGASKLSARHVKMWTIKFFLKFLPNTFRKDLQNHNPDYVLLFRNSAADVAAVADIVLVALYVCCFS